MCKFLMSGELICKQENYFETDIFNEMIIKYKITWIKRVRYIH